MKMARESWLLAGICLLDLATTLWLVHRYGAIEANSLMRYYLHLGYLPFVAVKMLLVAGPLCVLEWARRRRPQFVTAMLRVAVVLYVALYASVVWRVNGRSDSEEDLTYIESITTWASQPTPPVQIKRIHDGMMSISATAP